MRINQNISAMNTYSRLTSANNAKSGSLAKLSSGLRINRAGDDAAGLAISEKMRGQVGGLKQATRNAQDGISLIQTAEGALTETHSILNRMRELAVQASTDTNTNEDRIEIQKEIDELATEVTRISKDTEFNTMELLDGSRGAANNATAGKGQLTFHIGANEGQNLKLNIEDMGAKALKAGEKVTVDSDGKFKITIGESDVEYEFITAAASTNGTASTVVASGYYDTDGNMRLATDAAFAEDTELSLGLAVNSQTAADAAITTIDDAINKVSAERSKLGATQNRLEHTINNLTATAENLSEAESRIRDVDMAEEMMEFTKNNILSQAATSMLAQANQMPQSVLQLLQ